MHSFRPVSISIPTLATLGLALAALATIFLIAAFRLSPPEGAPANVVQSASVDTKLGTVGDQTAPASTPTGPTPSAPAAQPVVGTSGSDRSGCALSFTVAPSSASIARGGALAYRLTLKNIGAVSCENTSFSLYYPTNQTFVSATPTPSASNYYWRVGQFASGASFSANVTTTNADGSDISFEGCATADNAPGDACATVDTAIAGGGAATAAPISAVAPSEPFSVPPSKEFGVWIWDTPLQLSNTAVTADLKAASENGMNAIYITIDDYLTIAALPDGPDKTSKQQAYFAALDNIITQAHLLGIAVDVEGGADDWAEPANTWKGYALIDFVTTYNKTHPTEEIRGLQYDVESYLLPAYTTNQSQVLEQFVAFIDASAERMEGTDAAFTVVIPHFYDATQAWTTPFGYNGMTAYPYTQLLRVLRQKPRSTLIIMAYRNFFTGANGVQDLTTPEFMEAAKGSYPTQILIAQETGNVQPPYVTFYGKSKADFLSAVSTIYANFAQYPNFGGVSVEYIDPYLQLGS